MNITTFCILSATVFFEDVRFRIYNVFTACLRVASVPKGLGYILEVPYYFITDFQGVIFVKSGITFLMLRSLILGLKKRLGREYFGVFLHVSCTVVTMKSYED